MGLSFEEIQKGIFTYKGVRRRFDIKGTFNDIMVVDDYAHHPTEVEAPLSSAKAGWDKRIIAVFQPHLFSRTRHFFREFSVALTIADVVLITDIYPAREKPIPGVTSKLIYDILLEKMEDNCYLVPALNDLKYRLDKIIKPGDMLITMGAGNIWRYSESYSKSLSSYDNGVED